MKRRETFGLIDEILPYKISALISVFASRLAQQMALCEDSAIAITGQVSETNAWRNPFIQNQMPYKQSSASNQIHCQPNTIRCLENCQLARFKKAVEFRL